MDNYSGLGAFLGLFFFLWWVLFSDPHTFTDDELHDLKVNEWNDGHDAGMYEICNSWPIINKDIYIEQCN
jgi:hypothetical protein